MSLEQAFFRLLDDRVPSAEEAPERAANLPRAHPRRLGTTPSPAAGDGLE